MWFKLVSSLREITTLKESLLSYGISKASLKSMWDRSRPMISSYSPAKWTKKLAFGHCIFKPQQKKIKHTTTPVNKIPFEKKMKLTRENKIKNEPDKAFKWFEFKYSIRARNEIADRDIENKSENKLIQSYVKFFSQE